ncbi:MAG: recombinase family protein [Pseudomonadota bacterium]
MDRPPLRIAYARVSTEIQEVDRQLNFLKSEADELYVEKLSAVAAERPVFEAVMARLQPGDQFVLLDLDRGFRSAIDAILTLQALRERNVRLRVLNFPLNAESEEGEMMLSILAIFAQFERRMISRRTREGLAAAKRRGQRLGRPPALTDQAIQHAYAALTSSDIRCADLAEQIGVSRLTLQRGFHRLGLKYPVDEKSL